MKLKPTLTYTAILAAFTCAPAYAIWPVTDTALINVVQMGNQIIVQTIQGAQQNIVQELKKIQAGQDAAADKVSQTVSQSTDNAIKRNVDTHQAAATQQVERNTRKPIDPCGNGAIGMSGPNVGRTNPGINAAARSVPTGSAQLDKAIAIAKGHAPAPSPEVQASLAQAGACAQYAAGGRAQVCKASGVATASAPALPNADVSASSLISGAQSETNAELESLTFSSEQVAAATAYLRNVANPLTLQELPAAQAKTDDGRRYLALRDAHRARLDLAMRPSNEWLGNRMANDKLIPILKSMLAGQGAAAEYLKVALKAQAPDWATKGISAHQLMDIEAARRYRNPDWLVEIAQTSDPMTLQREQLMISALTADLLTRGLMEQQKSAVLLGTIYQATLNKDFMPEVLGQYRKAQGATR